jgi:hypothetical protein
VVGWLILTLLVLALAVGAVTGCRAEIATIRARNRLTADVAAVFGEARTRWDAGTAALSAAVTDMLNRPAATGFGDTEVTEELWRRALNAPALVEKESNR